MNQTQLAEKIGISQPYLNLIINGRKKPQWDTAKAIATATGTEPVLWLDGSIADRRSAIEKMRGES